MPPDFLCIGAQKAGTTWLHANLLPHPEIWVPPVKELHYFDHLTTTLAQRLLGREDYLAEARARLRVALMSADAGAAAWAFRYCLAPRSDAWYRSLFRPAGRRIAGEVTPSYARLPPERVAHIRAVAPDARIIYLLRNPIDWAWSNAVMHHRKPHVGGIERVPEEQVVAHFSKPKSLRHTDFLGNLANWERHFPRERIFVGFFDELQEDPAALLRRVLRFLGADDSPAVIPATVGERRNPGRSDRIPPRLLPHLARIHHAQIAGLHARFANNYTQRWLASAERHLEGVAPA